MGMGTAVVAAVAERRMEEIEIIPAVDNHLVPQDFGLKHGSFKEGNFTHGIAYYDAVDRSDPTLLRGPGPGRFRSREVQVQGGSGTGM